ncbi:MAG TPA: DUF5615 family PIN-like protein [Tepidisphaeraceae bacterium]|nr:DUF5615 family PIN-like protein [Tepidisphaeraceae bacterium]
MARFLIDVNLPYRFSFWHGTDYVHMHDLGDEWTDQQIWEYARENDLVIVSKDADFSDRIMLSSPPPRVVHVRLGNMKLRQLRQALAKHWPWVEENIHRFRLVQIYRDKVEGVSED